MAKDNVPEAHGGNFKLKAIKVFGSKENMHLNHKKYRKVFDLSECSYLYCELSFFNKLFDESDWKTTVKFICINRQTNERLCVLEREIPVSKEHNIVYVREGWGTLKPGWWKAGSYAWEVLAADQKLGGTSFFVVDGGQVTKENNPYFALNEVRLYESPQEGTPLGKRRYFRKLASDQTRYINVELRLQSRQTEKEIFPLELQFNVYNDAAQQKAFMHYFKEIKDHRDTILVDCGYGAQKPGYWYSDQYTIEVVFMDQLIAVIPFTVGDAAEEYDEGIPFVTEQVLNIDEISKKLSKEDDLSFEAAKTSLESLIGLRTVKEQINELAAYLQFLKIRKERGLELDQPFQLHSVFIGNPGTGKTTVANNLGRIYKSLGLLSTGKVIEASRADLVGEFIGQTAPKVKKLLEKAKGGVLLIDEAYALTNRGDNNKDFGQEVIEILLKELSDGKGDLAIIFAGYPKEMQQFLQSNAGLASRLRNVIHFPDYAPEELLQIALYAGEHKGVGLEEAAKNYLYDKLVEVYRSRDEQFGNARYVTGIIEEAKQELALRLLKDHEQLDSLSEELLSTITVEDIKEVFRHSSVEQHLLPVDHALLRDAIAQLHGLVGLEAVKREVEEMSRLVKYYREIGKDIRKAFSLHTVFTGNPGTGKTTVARILVQIYKALGVLERGHLIECDRKSLVAGHIGQTAIKTNQVIDKSIGGGLFIDEAYSLGPGTEKDFGKEAIETLMKRMEDQRGEFMVIVAGYPEEMKGFLEMNPGLMSRFDKSFLFQDFSKEELLQIAEAMLEEEELRFDQESKELLEGHLDRVLSNRHKYFGNARSIRKLIKEVVRRQNLRMAQLHSKDRSKEAIQTVVASDLKGYDWGGEIEESRSIGFR